MSRTIKGSKGPGYEYWSRRNYRWLTYPGRTSKTPTLRRERRLARLRLAEEVRHEDNG
jgi:hypothetical protein